MGASASMQASLAKLDPTVAKKLQQLEAAKVELAKADEKTFKFECNKLLKDHLVLIDLFTTKTKSQLRKFMEANYNETSDLEELLGNEYGKFMSALTLNSVDVDFNMTKLALSGVGVDEELLISIFCCRSALETQAIAAVYKREMHCDLAEVVVKRTMKNSKFFSNILSVFFSKILTGDRYEGTYVDDAQAKEHAIMIKTIPSIDFNRCLDILCSSSRFHCAAINEECKAQYNCALIDLIREKIGNTVAYEALRYWCSPLYESYVNMLQHFHRRSDIIYNSVARLNKRDLSAVNEVSIALYGEPLIDLINSGISGNLKRAVVSWIEQPPFDGGCEDELNSWLVEQSIAGYTLDQLMGYQESYEYLVANLTLQIESYQRAGYGRNDTLVRKESQKHLTKHEEILQTMNKSASTKNMNKSASTASVASKSVEDYSNLTESQLNDKKKKVVKEYLNYAFTLSDLDASDEMSQTEFNIFLDYLDMSRFGYSSEEVDLISSYADSDGSGYISFKEVKHEMTDMIINGIEDGGENVFEKVEELLTALKAGDMSDGIKKKKPKKGSQSSVKGDPDPRTEGLELPADLQSYLFDTFEGYDLDKNKNLDSNEFWQFMQTLNLGLTSYDIEALKFSWDIDSDGGVSWKEALPKFVEKLHGMASDQRDHFIGLLDKTSGYLFWYNLRDKSTQWMSEEDQAIYAPGQQNLNLNLAMNGSSEDLNAKTGGSSRVQEEQEAKEAKDNEAKEKEAKEAKEKEEQKEKDAIDFEAQMKSREEDLKLKQQKEVEEKMNEMKQEYEQKMKLLEEDLKNKQIKEQDEDKARLAKEHDQEKAIIKEQFEAEKRLLQLELDGREERVREQQLKDMENRMKLSMLQKEAKQAQEKASNAALDAQMNKLKQDFDASQKALDADLKARQERQQRDLQKRLDNKRKELMYEMVVEEGLLEEEATAKVDVMMSDFEDVIVGSSNEDLIAHINDSIETAKSDEGIQIENLKALNLKEEDFKDAVKKIKDLQILKLAQLESELDKMSAKERSRLVKRLEEKNRLKDSKKEMRKNLTSEYQASLKSLEEDLKNKQEKRQNDLQKRLDAKRADAIKTLQDKEGLSAEAAAKKAELVIEEEVSMETAVSNAALSAEMNKQISVIKSEQTAELKKLKTLGLSEKDYNDAVTQCKELHSQKLSALDSALESMKAVEKSRLAARLEEKKKQRVEEEKVNVTSIQKMKLDFDIELQNMEESNAKQETIAKAKKEHEASLKALEVDLKSRHEKEQKDIQKRLEAKKAEVAKRLQEEQKLSKAEAEEKAAAAVKEEGIALLAAAKEVMTKQLEVIKKPPPPRIPTYLRGLDLDGDGIISEAEMSAGKQMQAAKLKELENAKEAQKTEDGKRLQARLAEKKAKNSKPK